MVIVTIIRLVVGEAVVVGPGEADGGTEGTKLNDGDGDRVSSDTAVGTADSKLPVGLDEVVGTAVVGVGAIVVGPLVLDGVGDTVVIDGDNEDDGGDEEDGGDETFGFPGPKLPAAGSEDTLGTADTVGDMDGIGDTVGELVLVGIMVLVGDEGAVGVRVGTGVTEGTALDVGVAVPICVGRSVGAEVG